MHTLIIYFADMSVVTAMTTTAVVWARENFQGARIMHRGSTPALLCRAQRRMLSEAAPVHET